MRIRISLLCIVIILPFGLVAQTAKTDSLESLINSVSSDTTKVWLLNDLVSNLRERDNKKALKYASQARDLAELLHYKRGLAQSLIHMGWISYRTGEYSKSLSFSTEALKVSEQIPDQRLTATAFVNLAAIYYEQKQYSLAITNFRKGYAAANVLGDALVMSRCANNIAFTFLGLHKLDSAEHYARRALVIAERNQLHYMVGFAYRTLGDILTLQDNWEESFNYFKHCFKISNEIDNIFLKASVLHRIAKVHVKRAEMTKAKDALFENIRIGKIHNYKDELERAYKLLSEIYFTERDLEKAYYYQSEYVALHDSLYNQRSSEQLALVQTRFETEMKQTQIELLTKDSQLKAQQIHNQQIWIYIYVGGLSLLLILAAVLFYNNRYNKKAKEELEFKTKAIQQQAHQLKNLNATKDKLFSIISHDLRSPVASLKALMEIVSNSGLSQEEFVDISKVLKRNLDSVFEDLNNLLLWAQSQLKGIHAVPEPLDLCALVNEKVELHAEPSSVKQLQVVNKIPPGILVWADRNHLRLVIRNLLGNAIKFNKIYGTIEISCVEKGDLLEISVTDTGVGISSEDMAKLFNAETHFTRPGTQKEKGVGIGLLLAKEFIEKNNGTIRVLSEPGRGSTFVFTLKICKEEVFIG